jgi:hypothetical protein
MTGPKNGHSGAFRVTMSGNTAQVLKQFHSRAIARGVGSKFLAAFRIIEQRLRTDPVEFGEPLYRLAALELVVCHAAVTPLVVDYAVHESRRLVFIRGFKILE